MDPAFCPIWDEHRLCKAFIDVESVAPVDELSIPVFTPFYR